MATFEEARKAVDSGDSNSVIAVAHTPGFWMTKDSVFNSFMAKEARWEIYDRRREYTIDQVTESGLFFLPEESVEIMSQLDGAVTCEIGKRIEITIPGLGKCQTDTVVFSRAEISTFEKEISTREIVSDSGYLELNVSLPKGAKPGKWKVTCERVGGENV